MSDLDDISNLDKSDDSITSPYFILEIENYVDLYPNDLLTDNIYVILKNKLKSKHLKKCLENYGYIDAIYNIIEYSSGEVVIDNFDGLIRYKVKYNARVCNPNINNLIECKITNINNNIISAEYGPIIIIISIDNINLKKFRIDDSYDIINIETENKLKTNDNIVVKILMTEFYDKKENIFIFGYLEKCI